MTTLFCRFPNQVYDYRCVVEGVDDSTGRPRVKLGKLQTFAAKVLEFLKEAIDQTYPMRAKSPAENNEQDQESLAQDKFIELKSHFILGREEQLNTLNSFIQGKLQKSDDSFHLKRAFI